MSQSEESAEKEITIHERRVRTLEDLQSLTDNPNEIIIIDENDFAHAEWFSSSVSIARYIRRDRNCTQYLLLVEKYWPPSPKIQEQRVERRTAFLDAGGDLVVESENRSALDSCIRSAKRSLIRREKFVKSGMLEFPNGLRIDRFKMRAYADGKLLELSSGEFVVLCVLAQEKGGVLSSKQLLASAREKFPSFGLLTSEKSVTPFISYLREKLLNTRVQIKTVRDLGYALDV